MKENWDSYENQQFGDAFDGSTRLAGRTLMLPLVTRANVQVSD